MATDFGFLPATSGEHYFVSYNTEDTDRVRPIAQALHRAGVPLWYDYGLEYGKEWERQIALSIHRAKAVIMFVTDAALRKTKCYVRKEFDIADTYNVDIIPVLLDNIAGHSLPEHSIGWWMDIRALHSVRCVSGESAEQMSERIVCALGMPYAAIPDSLPAEPELVPFASMSAEVLNELGEEFYYGRNGKAQNYRSAVACFLEAAGRGNAAAQNTLAFCYYKGVGTDQSYPDAVKWYLKAAEQGVASAQCNLGLCYAEGLGVAKNEDKAIGWFRKAAQQGHPDAIWELKKRRAY